MKSFPQFYWFQQDVLKTVLIKQVFPFTEIYLAYSSFSSKISLTEM